MIRKPTFAILLLALSALACAGIPGGIEATPTSAFTTATPGGSVSVSLLGTPPTSQPVAGQITTPISPLATATIAAMTAIAQTATAAAPTAIVESGGPSICPAPGNPSLPENRPLASRLPKTIEDYLSAGGPPTLLEVGLRNWGVIGLPGGLIRADRDLTGDAIPEVLVITLDPGYIGNEPLPGDLLIYTCEAGKYKMLFQHGEIPEKGSPSLEVAEDLTGDSVTDLLYTIQVCSAAGCVLEIHVLGYNAANNTFGSLLAGPISEFQAQIALSDDDANRVKEIAITSGINEDSAAGPQRTTTSVLAFDGNLYQLARVVRSPVEYRIHLLYDADDYLASGDTTSAIETYKAVISRDDLLAWQYPDERSFLTAFARFRLMVAFARAGDVNGAQNIHDQTLALFLPIEVIPGLASPTPDPAQAGRDFASITDLFWQNFAINRDVARACQGVSGYVASHLPMLAPLNSFGYSNRTYTPETVCGG